MVNRISLFIFLISLGIVSCEKASPGHGKAEVEIILCADEGTGSVADTEITLNYIDENGMQVMMSTEKIAKGHYLALLPADCTPGTPFTVISSGENKYYCSIADTIFRAGERYIYSLKIGADGSSLIISVEEWEIVDTTIDLS